LLNFRNFSTATKDIHRLLYLYFMKCAAYILLLLVAVAGCQKQQQTAALNPRGLSYGDTLFNLKASDYTISPTTGRTGLYTAFPDNLNIDPQTGAINVTLKGKDGENTQTGLRYRIVYQSPEGKTDTTYIVLAGITYQDKIYVLSGNETRVTPIYNGSRSSQLTGGTFSSSHNKLALNPSTGEIDLKKSVENSFFHNDPRHADWEVVTISYKLNEKDAVTNSLDVVVYYYSSTNTIPSNVSAAMRAHQELLVGINPVAIPQTNAPIDQDIKNIVAASKPRPPCIVLIGRN
jgi:hypothetical protein